jgi:thiamine pyrophosphokinase
MSTTALVIAGGGRPDPLVVKAIPSADFVVAADSGADHAARLGLSVDLVVGDLDSIDSTVLSNLRLDGVDIEQHPEDKDQTDLELAMARAAATHPDRIVVVGIGGGRLDHALANVVVLAAEGYGDIAVEGLVGSARLTVVRGTRTLGGAVGEMVSLLAMLGPARGVTTSGLAYPLDDETLHPGSARGVSNRFVTVQATVTVDEGVLVAVQPYGLKERR